MPPFLQFRLWLRESPVSERVLTATAALVVVVLVVVAVVPVTNREDDAPTQLGATQSRATDTSRDSGDGLTTGDSVVSDGTGAATDGGTGAIDNAGDVENGAANDAGVVAQECAGKATSGPGISATEVLVDVSTISLAGPIGNSLFDIRTDLHEIATALNDEVNRTGGLACGRKLRINIYDVNPLDTNDAQAKCLQMVQDKPYVVLDFGAYLGQATRACFVQNKLPIISSVAVDKAEFKSAFPYVVSPRNLLEDQARDLILGLKDRGFFDAPKFKKLGLFVENCVPTAVKLIDQLLAQIGVASNQISKYTLDCNPAAPPNQISQGVLQHKAAGATHVILATATNNGQSYTRTAKNQGLQPAYGVSDLGEATSPSGAKNWDATFDGAIGITATHTGETFSGMRNANVTKCDEAVKRHGVKGFTTEAKDLALLALCDLFDFLRAAINKAGTNPVRTSFATGITQMGDFKTAYAGDGVFNRPDKYTGGDFQRAIQYHSDCNCWRVKDAFRPAYAAS